MFFLFFKLKNQKEEAPSSPPVLSIIDLQPPYSRCY
ncbi:hypothetical protein PanWU01x14_298840 [Parasponia andersonii]|uniref:Uncharacterized protein n=1 Tax=Parasponia andersonii TaxID=3476 RepID=A0A2P5AUM9_PARAD|nr:hypothetical protein PanWU01x14_298840 [Parasponia andersonii]